MYTQFVTILIFLIVGALIVPAMLLVGKILRPHNPNAKKLSTYECGEIPIGDSWVQFNLRFYVIAILFLIFEVEVALLLPIAVIFKSSLLSPQMGSLLVLTEIGIFIAILLIGFAYAWYKGDFEWIKPIPKNLKKKESSVSS